MIGPSGQKVRKLKGQFTVDKALNFQQCLFAVKKVPTTGAQNVWNLEADEPLNNDNDNNNNHHLVIVDTTAAPVLCIVGQ